MMPGIAIQTGFPLAAASAVRNVPPAADDRFSNALRERPKAPAQDDRKTDDAANNNAGPRETVASHDGRDGKVGQPRHAKDDSSADGGEKKDKDDQNGGTLPPHMMAERTLAGQWAGSGQAIAATNGPAAAGAPDGSTDTAAPTTGSTQAVSAAGANGAIRPETALPMQGLPAQPALAGKDGGADPAAPMQAGTSGTDPAQKGVSIIAVTAVEAGKAVPNNVTAAFTAKVAASQHPDSSPRAGNATPPAAGAEADTATQILQAAAGQRSGSADANADGQGDGGNGQSNNAAQNAAQLPSGTKGDAATAPLPTAQMVPSSGGATSFAGALQQGGTLARYAASAAAALAAGTPANALPTQSLSIQLRPVELGSVTAHLKYAGSGLTIDIQVETLEAHRRLSNDSSDIVKSLQSLGFQVDKVTVRQALAQPQTQSQGQPQGQAQGQSTGRDGSAGGFANQGGSPFSMSGQSGGSGHRQGSESGYENVPERGIGMVRETADRMPRRGVFI